MNREKLISEISDLFPLNLPNLKADINDSCLDRFTITYYQEKTFDDNRDWQIYDEWFQAQQELALKGEDEEKFPQKGIDPIYHNNIALIKKKITREDKILLTATYDFYGGNILYLAKIQRNFDQYLKGMGKQYFSNLVDLLKKRELSFLTCIPANNKLKGYWIDRGMIEVSKTPRSVNNFLRKHKIHEKHLCLDLL